jgi:ABC-type Mn2+/Zn2+ transport system ATPase subunit
MKMNKIKTDNSSDTVIGNLVEVIDVTFGYAPHKPILENVSVKIPKGRFVGLLGPSGSGKSTLLKIIIGLHRPWKGTIKFSGNKNSGPYAYSSKSIGYVPQVESIDWNFPVTVKEVIGMGIWNRSGVAPWFSKDVDVLVGTILGDLGIYSSEFRNRQIRELSGGEQQRVFLARALIRKPTILVLDEPISGVDYNTREKIMEILRSVNNDLGMTIIMTTHDLGGIGKWLPWVICMNKRVIAEGDPLKILTKDNLLRTYGLADYNDSIISNDNNSNGNTDNIKSTDYFTIPTEHVPPPTPERFENKNDMMMKFESTNGGEEKSG